MQYSIAICLGLDAIIAAGDDYSRAASLAGLRIDPRLVPLLYSDLAEYNGAQADGCLSWVRCTDLVAAEYGHGGACCLSTIMAEPFNYPRYVAALPEECEWNYGVVDLAVNVKGRELVPHQGIFEPWLDEERAFDVRGRI